jgi:serine/threonine protein phosphatase PrpC
MIAVVLLTAGMSILLIVTASCARRLGRYRRLTGQLTADVNALQHLLRSRQPKALVAPVIGPTYPLATRAAPAAPHAPATAQLTANSGANALPVIREPQIEERPPTAWLKATRNSTLDVLLTEPVVVVGRSPDCHVVLDDDTVSRRHLTLEYRDDVWYLRDEDTRNGTFLNGTRLRHGDVMPLESGDRLSPGGAVELMLTTPEDGDLRLELDAAAATARGGRERNEDSNFISRTTTAVADGVGGRPAGDVASNIATSILAELDPKASLRELIDRIGREIQRQAAIDQSVARMATTFDAMRIVRRPGSVVVEGVHIGDGVAMVDDGVQVRRLTEAHTVGARLAMDGNPAAENHPDRARLVRAIGLTPQVESDLWHEPATTGQRFVLSTDGLVQTLGLREFTRLVAECREFDPQLAANTLLRAGLVKANKPDIVIDNLTVVVADVVPAEERRPRELPPGRKNMQLSASGQR